MGDSEILKRLKESVPANTIIENWTVDNGYIGDDFVVEGISGNAVSVVVPNAINPQSIPIKDFELVFHEWDGYLSGSVKRHEIRDKTRYSKYIISIFHFMGL